MPHVKADGERASGEVKQPHEPFRDNRYPAWHDPLFGDLLRTKRLFLVCADGLVNRGLGVCCAVAHSNPSVAGPLSRTS